LSTRTVIRSGVFGGGVGPDVVADTVGATVAGPLGAAFAVAAAPDVDADRCPSELVGLVCVPAHAETMRHDAAINVITRLTRMATSGRQRCRTWCFRPRS
jgi:hypothetical protein